MTKVTKSVKLDLANFVTDNKPSIMTHILVFMLLLRFIMQECLVVIEAIKNRLLEQGFIMKGMMIAQVAREGEWRFRITAKDSVSSISRLLGYCCYYCL